MSEETTIKGADSYSDVAEIALNYDELGFAIPEGAMPQHIINEIRLRKLYPRTTSKGARNRVLIKATVPPHVRTAWEHFLETFTGGSIHKGSGIGSPMMTLSMKLMMAMVADFMQADVARDFGEIATYKQREDFATNLRRLANLIEA